VAEAGKRIGEARQEHPWIFFSSVLGGIGTFLGTIISAIALWAGNSSQQKPAKPAAETRVASIATPARYSSYYEISDNQRAISVEVPREWGTHPGNGWHPINFPPFPPGTSIGPGLNAAPNVKAWKNDLSTPGVFLGVSKKLAQAGYDPDKLLNLFFPAEVCRTAKTERYPNALYPSSLFRGRSQRWICSESGRYPQWYLLAALPVGKKSPLIHVQVKLVSPRDEQALERILSTFRIRTSAFR
jgi:hypothetical protein